MYDSIIYLFLVNQLLVSGELSNCWQHVRSVINESYPVCSTRLSVLSGLIPFLPLHTADDSRGAVTQSMAVADLCSTCARALIGSNGDIAADSRVISTMLDALVIAATYLLN